MIPVSQLKDKVWFQIVDILYSLPDHMYFTSVQPHIYTPGKHAMLKSNKKEC